MKFLAIFTLLMLIAIPAISFEVENGRPYVSDTLLIKFHDKKNGYKKDKKELDKHVDKVKDYEKLGWNKVKVKKGKKAKDVKASEEE